jgi:hypothetical protein
MATEPNPYKTPDFTDQQQPMYPTSTSGLSSAVLIQQRVLACLLIIHGLLCSVMGLFLGAMAIMMPAQVMAQMKAQGNPVPPNMEMILIATYGTMAASGLIPGLVQVIAGVQNFRLRNRIFGLVAFGIGALATGTCYCAPTAIGLLIYGLVIGLHETTKRAYELAAKGHSYDEIMHMASQRK